MKINAAVAFGPLQPLTLTQIDLRDPGPGEVMIRMVATGICHSDIAILDGDNPGMGKFPMVLGHEGAGVVSQVGEGVRSLKVGDHVVLAPVPQCGICMECMSGRSNLCEELFAGFAQTGSPFSLNGEPVYRYMHCGSFAEYVVTKEIGVTKIHADAPLDKACVAACCVATGAGAAIFAGKVRPGSSVAVFGMGGIGVNAIQGARLCGATKIIAVDVNSNKEDIARQFGATHFVNPRLLTEDVSSHIFGIVSGGVDVAIEAVGHPEVIRQALASTRMGSGMCVVVGMMPDGARISLGAEDLGIGRSLRTSAAGDMLGRSDTSKLVEWYMDGKLMFDELITGTFVLDDINEAIEGLRSGKAIRNVIQFQP